MVAQPGDEFCLTAHGWRRWCSLFVPNELLADQKESTTALVRSVRGVLRLRPDRMAYLRSAMQHLDESVQRSPNAFQSTRAQNAAQQRGQFSKQLAEAEDSWLAATDAYEQASTD